MWTFSRKQKKNPYVQMDRQTDGRGKPRHDISQGCGIPMPDLSDSRLFGGGQADFTLALVHGQVNLGEIQYHNIQFHVLSMVRNAISTRFKASHKMENMISGSIVGLPVGVVENIIGYLQKHCNYRLLNVYM